MTRILPRLLRLAIAAGILVTVDPSAVWAGGKHHGNGGVQSVAIVGATPVAATSVATTPVVMSTASPVYVTTTGHGLGLFHHRQAVAAVPVQAAVANAGQFQVSSGFVSATPTVSMVSSVAATPTVSVSPTVGVSPTYVGYSAGSNLFMGNPTVASSGFAGSDGSGDDIDTLVSSNPRIQTLVGRLGNNRNHLLDLKNHLHTAIGKQLRQGGNLQGNRGVNFLMRIAASFLKARFGIDLDSLFETGTRSGVQDLIDQVLSEENDTIGDGGTDNTNDNTIRDGGSQPLTRRRYQIRGTIEVLDGSSQQGDIHSRRPNRTPNGHRRPIGGPGPDDSSEILGDADAPAAPPGR
jgi:hypothetical protein